MGRRAGVQARRLLLRSGGGLERPRCRGVSLTGQICDLRRTLAARRGVRQATYRGGKRDPPARELAVGCPAVPDGPETQRRILSAEPDTTRSLT